MFRQLLEGKLSPDDTEALIGWLGSDNPDPEMVALVQARLKEPATPDQLSPELLAALESRLPAILGHQKEKPVHKRVHILHGPWLRYAAAVLVILFGTIAYLWITRTPATPKATVENPVAPEQDVAPGKEGAILTLADGSTVVLDSLGNGWATTQNGSKILLRNGQLLYDTEGPGGSVAYNTMTTPKGRQFQVVLADGTKVWLNAASSLRYPTAFTGAERIVEITGEAYFEVAKNTDAAGRKKPFRVKVNDQTMIEVLGTHFNINSYKDEASINTTLLEGSVQVVNNGSKALLQPGQQAQVKQHAIQQGPIKIVSAANVNMEKVMAWKNGVFNFQDASLEEVMRQLERWYDIEVVYEKDIPKLEFFGKMGRDLSLSDVLRGLAMSKVHSRIEGRRVVILP